MAGSSTAFVPDDLIPGTIEKRSGRAAKDPGAHAGDIASGSGLDPAAKIERPGKLVAALWLDPGALVPTSIEATPPTSPGQFGPGAAAPTVTAACTWLVSGTMRGAGPKIGALADLERRASAPALGTAQLGESTLAPPRLPLQPLPTAEEDDAGDEGAAGTSQAAGQPMPPAPAQDLSTPPPKRRPAKTPPAVAPIALLGIDLEQRPADAAGAASRLNETATAIAEPIQPAQEPQLSTFDGVEDQGVANEPLFAGSPTRVALETLSPVRQQPGDGPSMTPAQEGDASVDVLPSTSGRRSRGRVPRASPMWGGATLERLQSPVEPLGVTPGAIDEAAEDVAGSESCAPAPAPSASAPTDTKSPGGVEKPVPRRVTRSGRTARDRPAGAPKPLPAAVVQRQVRFRLSYFKTVERRIENGSLIRIGLPNKGDDFGASPSSNLLNFPPPALHSQKPCVKLVSASNPPASGLPPAQRASPMPVLHRGRRHPRQRQARLARPSAEGPGPLLEHCSALRKRQELLGCAVAE